MKRRLLMAAGMSALLLATLLPSSAAARSPEGFGRPDLGGRTPDLSRLPSRQDPDRTIDVIVRLSGAPVADSIDAAAEAGRTLSEAERSAVRQPLLSRQTTLKTQMRALGARVDGSYTDVLNGVRINVAAGQLPRIAELGNVLRIYRVQTHYRDNTNTVDFLKADVTWGRTGFTGEGVRVAILDTGINYYHADFGGLRDPEFTADTGLDRSDGNFPTAKVVAGYDLVGDAYNPGSDIPGSDIPNPDNDPLDCKDPDAGNVQHGTHVAGTAAGQGVLDDGSTFNGPYDEDTLANYDFRIGPGTAPRASLMAYRVFGCDGGTNIVVDAVERATRDGADIINMSLGSLFGNPNSADALAVDGASKAGVTVVMSSGNSGPSAYITGSPGIATRGIAVAALDAVRSFPAATVEIEGGADVDGIIANGDTDDLPATGDLNVFADDPATPCDSDTGGGCEESGVLPDSYVFNAYVAGQIPVTFRGNGARVDRASQGDTQGAPAVIMVNNAPGLPPFEGEIEGADIPFVGVSSEAAADLVAGDGDSATITDAGVIANPNFKHTASFTSGGPRRFDNMIKPDIAAPGVSVASANGATVDGPRLLSGTSMASPATAGVAALVLEANPGWTPKNVKSALIGTASPNRVVPYEVRQAGAGVVNPRRAVNATGLAWAGQTTASLAFGAEQLGKDPSGSTSFRETLSFNISNKSSSPVTYQLSNQFQTASLGANVSISPSTVTIAGNSSRRIDVTLRMSESEAAALPDTAPLHGPDLGFDSLGQLHSPLTHVAGAIVANVIGGDSNDIRVPYLLAPRGLSRVNDRTKAPYTEAANRFKSSVRVKNTGLHSGIADVYQWGLADGNDGLDGIDIRAAGVQTLPTEVCTGAPDRDDRCVVIAINTWNKWSNASENEFDVVIDADDDDEADYAVIGVDAGAVLGALDGIYVSLIVDLSDGSVVDVFFATAPNNGATMLLPVLASEIGLSRTGDRDFEYIVESFDFYDDDGTLAQFDFATTGDTPPLGTQEAHYNAFRPVISNGDFIPLDAGDSAIIPLSVRKATYDPTNGMKGWMIVTLEDESGQTDRGQYQADLIPVGELPD